MARGAHLGVAPAQAVRVEVGPVRVEIAAALRGRRVTAHAVGLGVAGHATLEALARRLSGVLVGSAVDEFVSHPDFSIEDPRPGSSVTQILADIEAEIGDTE